MLNLSMHCYSSVNKHVHAFHCYMPFINICTASGAAGRLQVAVATALVLTTVATVGVLICVNHSQV